MNAAWIIHWVLGAILIGYYFFWLVQQIARRVGHLDAKTENAGMYGIIKIFPKIIGLCWIGVLVTGIYITINSFGWSWPIIIALVVTVGALIVGFGRMIPLSTKIEKIKPEEMLKQSPKELALFNQLTRLEAVNGSFVLIGVIMVIVASLT